MTERATHDHHTEQDTDEHDTRPPNARQLLHWATGDRQAEAKALADASDEEVTEDDAELAVRRSHGDLGAKQSPVEGDLAAPEDADAAHEERAHRR